MAQLLKDLILLVFDESCITINGSPYETYSRFVVSTPKPSLNLLLLIIHVWFTQQQEELEGAGVSISIALAKKNQITALTFLCISAFMCSCTS